MNRKFNDEWDTYIVSNYLPPKYLQLQSNNNCNGEARHTSHLLMLTRKRPPVRAKIKILCDLKG
jgi:hypothetical protein